MIRKKILQKRIKKLEESKKELLLFNKELKVELKDIHFRCNDLMKKYNSLIGEINLKYYELLPEEKYEEEAKKRFLMKTGGILDLKEPKSLNEKIQWMKFNENDPKKTMLSNKLAVREWVAKNIGEDYLNELYGDWSNFDEIDIDKLPKRFVLKANHGSEMAIVVDDKNKMDIESIRRKVNKWMVTNYAYKGLEMHYKDISPRVMAEEHMGASGKDFLDYKFWCFHGRVEFIKTLNIVNGEVIEECCYDREWRKTPFQAYGRKIKPDFDKPALLKEMMEVSEKLSKEFKFVRVDLYQQGKDKIKFGEMTFTPGNGEHKWVPDKYDKILGDILIL